MEFTNRFISIICIRDKFNKITHLPLAFLKMSFQYGRQTDDRKHQDFSLYDFFFFFYAVTSL